MELPLESAVQKLIAATQELGIADKIPAVDPQKLASLTSHYSLPPDLVKWYSLAEPGSFQISLPAANIHFVSSDEFEQSLVGYAYTWQGGSKMIPDNAWNPAWLVIGGEGEYPVIVMKENTGDHAVYYAEAIDGIWRLNLLSNNLSGFLSGIAGYLQLFLGKYKRKIYKGELMSSDYKLDQRFVDDFSSVLDSDSATRGRTELWLKRWLGL
jgi:hypothetical protein